MFWFRILKNIGNGNVMVAGLLGGICYRKFKLYSIFECIDHGNIIHFCYYNNNRSTCSRNNMIGISNGNVIGYSFRFWYVNIYV